MIRLLKIALPRARDEDPAVAVLDSNGILGKSDRSVLTMTTNERPVVGMANISVQADLLTNIAVNREDP